MEHLRGPGSIAERLVATAMEYLASARDPESGGLMVEICSESLRNTTVGARFCELEAMVRESMRAASRRRASAARCRPTSICRSPSP